MLTLFIRIFVPESDRWLREKEVGSASHWSSRDLLAVLLGAGIAAGVITVWAVDFPLALRVPITVVGLVLVAACYLFPARQYFARATADIAERRHTLRRMLLGAGLSGVPLLGTWAGLMWMYPWVQQMTQGKVPTAAPTTQIVTSCAAMLGCLVAAVLGGRLGRRPVYATLCVLSGVTLLGFYQLETGYGAVFLLAAFVVSGITAAFYGWLPLYLPELFPTKVRATGQGFAFNFGRILAAIGALQTGEPAGVLRRGLREGVFDRRRGVRDRPRADRLRPRDEGEAAGGVSRGRHGGWPDPARPRRGRLQEKTTHPVRRKPLTDIPPDLVAALPGGGVG